MGHEPDGKGSKEAIVRAYVIVESDGTGGFIPVIFADTGSGVTSKL